MTIACLNTVGNVPESSGCFKTWVSAGTISSEQSSKRDVVIGSRSHVLKVIFFKRAETAVSLTALKWVSGFPEKKLISKTRGSSARATVNVLPYGADFFFFFYRRSQKTSEGAEKSAPTMVSVYILFCS